jgi:hypothetical protein
MKYNSVFLGEIETVIIGAGQAGLRLTEKDL